MPSGQGIGLFSFLYAQDIGQSYITWALNKWVTKKKTDSLQPQPKLEKVIL